MAKFELTESLCYMAGLYSKSPKKEKNHVVLNTGIESLRDRFVEIAVKDLGVDPMKIKLEEEGLGASFYHSRVAKNLANIVSRETYIFKTNNAFARNYLAGMFDVGGHFRDGSLTISHILAPDAIMLENLGIHSKNDRILNGTKFIELVKGISIVMDMVEERRKNA